MKTNEQCTYIIEAYKKTHIKRVYNSFSKSMIFFSYNKFSTYTMKR